METYHGTISTSPLFGIHSMESLSRSERTRIYEGWGSGVESAVPYRRLGPKGESTIYHECYKEWMDLWMGQSHQFHKLW
jgi:hypothetical protein